MAGLYPDIEPYERSMLKIRDSDRRYWESCGNPQGKPGHC